MTIMAWLPNRTNHMIFLDIVIYLYFDFPVLELYNAALRCHFLALRRLKGELWLCLFCLHGICLKPLSY